MCRSSRRSCRRGSFLPKLLLISLVAVGIGCVAKVGQHEVSAEQSRTLPTVGTHRVRIRTDNGAVTVRPAAEGIDTIHVRAIIRATGDDAQDAGDCLEAIEIACPVSGANEATQDIGWAWRNPPERTWGATVSFEVTMPPALELDVRTDNGQIDVVGITGDCEIKTDNGAIRAVAATNKLSVAATNGSLTVESPAGEIQLSTTNGAIRGSLTNRKAVAGKIATENGEIRVALAETAGTRVECRTANGRIKNELPLTAVDKKGKSRLAGELSGGGDPLKITSTNGGITLTRYKPQRDKHDD